MANQQNPTKVKLQLWVDKSLIAQIDGVAARKGVSRATVVTEAVRRYLDDGDRPATKSDLVALAATLTHAIESRPVEVQVQASPDAGAIEPPEQAKAPLWRRLLGRGRT